MKCTRCGLCSQETGGSLYSFTITELAYLAGAGKDFIVNAPPQDYFSKALRGLHISWGGEEHNISTEMRVGDQKRRGEILNFFYTGI